MKHYHLTIISKTKESINDFLIFLYNTSTKFNTIKKYFKNKKRKKVLTLLKSPHIYKTAQEQFELNFFFNQTNIYSNDNFRSLIFLKKIKNNLFPSIKIKIQIPINRNLLNKTRIQILNPSNFKLGILQKYLNQKNRNKRDQKKNYQQVQNLLKIFDLYGELIQKI